MPIVQMPDGTPVDFGDLPPDQIRALIAKKFPDSVNAARVKEVTIRPSPSTPAPAPEPAQPQQGNLNPGVQGAGKGIAELLFGIPDLVNMATNLGLAGASKASQFVGGPSIDYRFSMPSENVANLASNLGEKVGITTTNPADMNFKDRAAYNINRFGAQIAGGAPALAKIGAARAAEIAAGGANKFFDPLVAPYAEATTPGQVARLAAGDAAGAIGSGLGETVGEKASNNPAAAAGGALAGGVGGVGALGAAEGLGRLLLGLGKRIPGINGMVNYENNPAFRNPETGAQPTKKVADQAARMVQIEVTPERAGIPRESAVATARARLLANQAQLTPELDVLPSSSALTENPGLAVLNRRVQEANPGTKIARDQEFQTGVRDALEQIAPEGATAEPLQAKAQAAIDAQRAAAQEGVNRVERNTARLNAVREAHGEEVAGYRGQKPAASQALDTEIINKSLIPMDAARRRRYEEAPNVLLPGQPIYEAAQAVRAGTRDLPPAARAQVLPSDRVSDFEKLAAPIRDEQGNVIGYKDVPAQTLNKLRPIISSDKAKARLENAPPARIDNLRSLQDTITRQTEDIPEYAEANRFYNEEYAPVYGREAGEAYKFRQDVNKDRLNRTASPPSETAGRFLVAGSPEKTEALQRIFLTMQDPTKAQFAARQYLMADLAEKNVIDAKTGFLRPNTIRNWALKNQNTLDAVPGLKKEVSDLLARADKGERLGGKFAAELKQARQNQNITEAQINRSAFRSVVDADPDKAVASIMADPTSSGQKLRQLVALTKGDDAARNGLKAAVRDYIIDRATTTANQNLVPGDERGPVSFAKLTNLFNEHEKELAEVFDPDEMNTLRVGHKALQLANRDNVRATRVGSNTAENIVDRLTNTDLGKGIEAFARFKFGLLKAGGLKATARRLASGIGKDEANEITRLVERATVDPELMGLLLGRKLPIGSPRWNAKLNELVGVAEFGRKEAPNP